MPYLTDSVAYTTATQVYRYFAELASKELDHEGIPVRFKTIDVLVLEPTRDAIAQLINSCEWLSEYSLVDFWSPTPDEESTPF